MQWVNKDRAAKGIEELLSTKACGKQDGRCEGGCVSLQSCGGQPGLLALSSTCPVDCAASPVPVVPVFVSQDLGQDGSCLWKSHGGWCKQCLRFVLNTWICSPSWFPCPPIKQLEDFMGRHLQVYRKTPEEKAQCPFIVHIIYLTWIKNGTLKSNTHLADLSTTPKDSELPITWVENTLFWMYVPFMQGTEITPWDLCV